jgi:hypothetical protein
VTAAVGRAGHWLPLLVCCLPLLAALVLAFRDGGYFIVAWGSTAIALLGALAAAAMIRPGAVGGRLGLIAICGWGALGVWQGLSALWADDPAAASAAMYLTLLYGAAFSLVLVCSAGPLTLRRLIPFSLLVATVVAVAAVATRLLPSIAPEEESGRLATPISYWNSLGLVAAFGAVLAVGVAADPARGRLIRAPAGATLPLFALVILFTQSRGALLVVVVGLAALVAIGPTRILTLWMVGVAAAVGVPLLGYANDQPSLSPQLVLREAHGSAGARVAVALVAAGGACALGSLAVTPIARRLAAPARRRAVGAIVAATLVAGAVAALAVRPPDGGPLSWADRQFEAFKSFDPRARDDATTVADRLVVAAGSGRWQNWSVAWDEFAGSPVTGTGAGDYRFRWAAERDIDIDVRNAHSLYLETLGESGLIGLTLLLIPLGAVGVAVAGARRRGVPAALGRDLGIAVAAGGAVALHLAGDWAWQMPAVTLPAIALGAAAIAASAGPAAPPWRAPRPASWAIAVACVAGILMIAGPVASSARLTSARAHAASGDLTAALADARDARRLDPQSFEPVLLEADILADLGRDRDADRAFADAIARSPHEWTTRADWASALIRRGDLPAVRALVRSAVPLNPRDPRLRLLQAQVGS